MNPSSQSEWVRSVLAEYQAPLTRYAAHITGDIERARDVVQDTFLRLCSQKPSRIQNHVAQWLFTVCRNRALDICRKENRMSSAAELEDRPAEDPQPSKVLEQKEQISRVLGLVKTLPANQQEVIRLKFQNGMTYREISHITDLSVSNVGFLIHTGLKTIRRKVNTHSHRDSGLLRRIK